MSITAEIDPRSHRAFNKTLSALAAATDRPVEDVLKQQLRLLSKDLAFHIHPRGVSASVGRDFKSSVQTFVLSLYRPVGWIHDEVAKVHGEAAAASIVKLIRRGKHAEARGLLEGRLRPRGNYTFIAVGPFDGGALHRAWRWKRRRRYPVMIVPNYPAARRYARDKAATTGLAKAALVQAGRDIDGKAPGIPAWIKRHSSAPGRGVFRRGRGGFSGYLESHVKYAREALPLADELRALDVRHETAEKQLKRITDANLKQAMRKYQGR